MASLERIFDGETVVCIASGPSLTQADVDAVRGKARVIVVNDAIRLAPFADVLYSGDDGWWSRLKGVPDFTGLKYTVNERAAKWATALRRVDRAGLDDDPSTLRTGGSGASNSGFQGIQLAAHFGAARILLLGYDCQLGPRGQKHFADFGTDSGGKSDYLKFREAFASLVEPLKARNIQIENCSRQTALTCFPRATIEDALADAPVLPPTTYDLAAVEDIQRLTKDFVEWVSTPTPSKPTPVIAVCLMTCGRLAYTQKTLETFTAQHGSESHWLKLHIDDGTPEPERSQILFEAGRHGFETVVSHPTRMGARVSRTAIVDAAARRGADWVLLLENDWEWVRPFPWALFEHLAATRPDVYSLRLYGQYKERGRKRPCSLKNHGMPPKKHVPWWPLPGTPEPVEIGRYHWGAPPAVTRLRDLQKILALVKGRTDTGDHSEMLASGQIDAYVARVTENCVFHIGAAQTAGTPPSRPVQRIVSRVVRPAGKPALYTPAWQAAREWTHASSQTCLDLALKACGMPTSMLDLGCGTGHLVDAMNAKGIPSVGVDVSVEHDTETVKRADLREPLDLGRQFDLVLCWEVAEHLPPESADVLCDTIVRHLAPGGTLLFTAATPGQGGHGHLTERPAVFWRMRLESRGLYVDPIQSANLGRAWYIAARQTPWYGKNLMVFRTEPVAAIEPVDVALPRVALTMRTADRSPNPNYVGGTIRRLLKQGIDPASIHVCATNPDTAWLDAQLNGAQVTVHVPERPLTPNQNGLAQIRSLDHAAYDWVLLLEDDLAFCADFMGSVQRWLLAHGRENRHLFRFFAFRVASPGRSPAFDYSLTNCAGSQAVALRMVDALDFLAWSDVNLETWGGFRGTSRIAFDKLLAAWHAARWPRVPGVVSHPFFVKHMGRVSSLHPKTAEMDRFFAGEAWRYAPTEATA